MIDLTYLPTTDDLAGVQMLFDLPEATPEIVKDLISTAFTSQESKRMVWDSLSPSQRDWLKT